MRTALDSNVLSSLWSNEPSAPALQLALRSASAEGVLLLCPVVLAELLAHPTADQDRIAQFLSETDIHIDYRLPDALWLTAGDRYARYAARRRKSIAEQPRRIVADYIIGAHALLRADRLMTLDSAVYRRDFPELRLVAL